MKPWNSHQPVDGRIRALASLFVIWLTYSAVAVADDGPARAKGDPASARFAPGSEVVLKVPDLPVFDQGRPISGEDHLTFTVEQSESGRLLLVSRDKAIRGWVYDDEVVSLEQANDYFDQVVVFDKFNLDAYWVLGRLWFYKNDDTRALVELNRAVGGGKIVEADYFLSRSLVLLRKKQIKKALEDCEKLIRLEPDSSQCRLVREKAQLANQDYAGAMASLEQAFRDDPVNPFPRGPAPGAPKETSADEATVADRPGPQTAAEFVASGEAWFARQEYDKAIKDYDAALKLDPRCAAAYVSRARAWVPKHYRERERADYDAAINLEPANAMYRVARAESWSARGLHDPAMADYAEALRLDPQNPSIWVSRGNEWRKDIKLDAALADFTQAIRLNPTYAPAYLARGNTWKQIRRFDRAIQEFSELIRIDPREAVAHQSLARILSTAYEDQVRNGKQALDLATRACELTHWIDPDALDTLATASAETGDFPSAIRWQTLAIKLVRQRFPSALQKKAVSMGGGRGAGVGFEDRLAFYKSKKPIRE